MSLTNRFFVGIAIGLCVILCVYIFYMEVFSPQAGAKTVHTNEFIRIYTDSGEILAEYEDVTLRTYSDGFVKFEWNGDVYTYINCYIEYIERYAE